MKKSTKSLRRNPPNFYEEIQGLVKKPTQVQIKGKFGFFSINDILYKKDAFIYGLMVLTENYEATILFSLRMINKIYANVIQLKSTNINWGEVDVEQVHKLVNRNVDVFINSEYWREEGVRGQPAIGGKLKYNRKDNLFYLQNRDLTIQVSFKAQAVVKIKHVTAQIEIVI